MWASAGIHRTGGPDRVPRGETGCRLPSSVFWSKGAWAMTLLDPIAAETLREASIPVLETERLVLRAPRLEDAESIAMLANERRIAENTARIPHPYTLADAKPVLAEANRADEETTFAIALTDGTIIGACGLELRDGPGGSGGPSAAGAMPELGCWLGVAYWGRGFATEAARALIDHAFTDLELETLQAGPRATNPASRRGVEKKVSPTTRAPRP